MVRRGELTPAQAAVHPHRSVITRALGTDDEVEPDVVEVPLEAGDRLLLCTDGLTGMVSDEEIAAILARSEEPAALADHLVQAALAGGGEDNVTVIVVELKEAEPEPPQTAGGDEDTERDQDAEADEEILVGPTERGGGLTSRVRLVRRARGEVRRSLGARDERAPRRRFGRRGVMIASTVVVVLAVLVGGFAAFNSSVYYVGTHNGLVALYRGLPVSFLGIELSSVVEEGTVMYETLAPYLRTRVDNHDLVSKEEGQRFLRSLSIQP